MHKASVAEWILSRFTDRDRAAAVVGDLLESVPPKSALRFWTSVAGIVFSLAWRRPIAFAAAYYGAFWWMDLFEMRIYEMHAAHRPPDAWMRFFGILSGIAILLWAISPYAIIRFGIRDRFARLVTGFTLLITVFIYFWWIPAVTVACLAVFVGTIVASIVCDPWRRPLLTLPVTVAFAFCGVLISAYFETSYQRHLDPTMGAYVRSPILTTYIPILMMLSVTSACSFAHRLLLRRRSRNLPLTSTD